MYKNVKKPIAMLWLTVMAVSFLGCTASQEKINDITVISTYESSVQTAPAESTVIESTEAATELAVQFDVMAAYEGILWESRPFFSTSYQEELTVGEYLDRMKGETGIRTEVTNYTVLDMDGDTVPELLLWVMVNETSDYGTMVIHTQEQRMEEYTFAYRQLFDLKADGSFALSGSESSSGYGKLQFTEAGWQYTEIPDQNQDEKESVHWKEYTPGA